MNLCLVSIQAILLAILVVQHHSIDEVEAEKQSFSVGNWFSSIEKKINVQFPYDGIEYDDNASDVTKENGTMNKLYQKIKKTAEDIAFVPTRENRQSTGTYDSTQVGGINISDLVNSQELADINAVTAIDASNITDEKNETEPEKPQAEVEVSKAPKKKKRNRKHKRKSKILHERSRDASLEKEKSEFSKRILRKNHKKKPKKRKFVKMLLKESNSSDSDETMQRGKPVDIIVHIKMNE